VRRTVTDFGADHWWWLAVPLFVAVSLGLAWAFWQGARRTALGTLAALTAGLVLLQIHTGWRLSYYEADVPKDMLVYTQTSPDVTRVMNEIDQLSAELTGGDHLEVWFDSGVSWPFQWYLRNYDQKRFIGASLTQDPRGAPILLLGDGVGERSSEFLKDYTRQDYVLRWWFPEETYRDFALAPELPVGRSALKSAVQPHGPIDILESIGDTVEHELRPESQLRLYRLLMYRDLDWEIGQTRFSLYIRNDLIPLYNRIRYS
jgi:hypothetical protein